jgi:hypothetical protein
MRDKAEVYCSMRKRRGGSAQGAGRHPSFANQHGRKSRAEAVDNWGPHLEIVHVGKPSLNSGRCVTVEQVSSLEAVILESLIG